VELVIALPWIWQLRLLSAFRSANQLRLSRCRNWHSVGPCHKAGFTLPTLVFIKQGLHVNVCATIFFETFMCRFPAFINQQIAYFNIISSWKCCLMHFPAISRAAENTSGTSKASGNGQ